MNNAGAMNDRIGRDVPALVEQTLADHGAWDTVSFSSPAIACAEAITRHGAWAMWYVWRMH